MFVQQMHFYNTIIEEMQTQTQSLSGRNSGGSLGNHGASKDCFSNPTSDDKLDSTNPSSGADDICQSAKSYNDALDRLRSYECRALNLFRDVDLIHIQQLTEC